jgi:DNA polymerase III sliding clamp (beta) subunit (PCNA family)
MKEIVLPVMALKEALPGLNKIVNKKTSLPVLSCVRLARDTDGKIHLQATDLDAFATYTAKEPRLVHRSTCWCHWINWPKP